jgi:hypothetical protein
MAGVTHLRCAHRHVAFPEHACLAQRGQQVFCVALAQEGEGLFDAKTFTWLDGSQLRKGTSYILASGSVIAIGNPCAPSLLFYLQLQV